MSTPTSSTITAAKTKGDAASVVAAVGTHYPLLIKDDAELLRYGVVRVPLCSAARRRDDEYSTTLWKDDEKQQHGMDYEDDAISHTVNNNNNSNTEEHPILDLAYWAMELSQVTPAILAAQGDNEYAFYRNVLGEPDFPFDDILRKSLVGEAMKRHFSISIAPAVGVDDGGDDDDDIRLDDAFCIHYNTSQEDSSGARHMDPCDITVNICLQASHDMQGSRVMFYGKQTLSNVPTTLNCPAQKTMPEEEEGVADESSGFSFLVEQIPGTATIHWGHHPHQTLPITAGKRTNVVMTYIYSDPSRKSDATTRTCYG